MISSINEIKQIMESAKKTVGESSDLFNDFDWFSKINYTTTTEYFGELRLFLLRIEGRKELSKFQNRFNEIISTIENILSIKSSNFNYCENENINTQMNTLK